MTLSKRVRKWRVVPGGPRYRPKRGGSNGKPYKKVSISIPVDELTAIDEFAERNMMERSLVIREAIQVYMSHRIDHQIDDRCKLCGAWRIVLKKENDNGHL